MHLLTDAIWETGCVNLARSLDLSTRSVLTAGAAAVLAGAVALSTGTIAGVLALVALAFAWGWPRLMSLPAPGGSSIVLGLAGLGTVLAVYATPSAPWLRNVPLVLAMGVVLAFVNELLRSDDRPRLVESLTGTVAGVVVVVSTAGWLAIAKTSGGEPFVAMSAAALAIASAVAAIPFYGWPSFGLTVLVGTGAGAIAARLLPGPGLAAGVVVGFVCGLLVASVHMLLARVPSLRGVPGGLAASAAPIAISGVLVYAVARLTMAS